MRCLIVSDSAVTRRILTWALRETGDHEIVDPSDHPALESGSDGVDLVMVEWDTNSGRGLEFVRQLRGTPGFASTAVLVVSARDAEEEIQLAVQAGANDYLLKPVNLEALAAKLARLADGAAASPGTVPAG
jgi:two-component system chemotaxis response regulator CheY